MTSSTKAVLEPTRGPGSLAKEPGIGPTAPTVSQTAAVCDGQILRIALRDRQIVEVHLIVDLEIFIERADQSADAPVIRRAHAQFLA